MTDISTIGAILGSIKTATDLAKLIKNSSSSLEEAEIKLKIAELINALADAKIEIAEIQTILLEKDNLISELRKQLELEASVVWEKPYYWKIEGDEKDGPFCQNCYDTEKKLIRLQEGGTNPWRCQSCGKSVKDDNFVRPKVNIPPKRGRF